MLISVYITIKNKMKNLSIVTLILCTGCIPATCAIGATTIFGSMAMREKGISGTFSDADLSAKIRSNFAKRDKEWKTSLSKKVGIAVENGEVLLTGIIDSTEEKMWAEQIVWEVFGVKQVVNQLEAKSDEPKHKSNDSWITAKVKSALFSQKHVKSLNYSVKTLNGTVYVMGIAKNEDERDIALHTIAKVKGVKKVVSLVRLKHEIN